jgi:hypothetical protein
MSTAYSTYPAFATPTPTGNAEWFKQRFQESAAPTKPITLKSGAVVPIPLLFWDARALCIEGHADADAFDVLLRDHGLRAARSGSEGTVVQIWAPDYGGTTLGPHKAVYAQVKIEPPRQCRKEEQEQLARRASWHGSTKMSADGGGRVDHWAVWWYYGTSPVNQEFVRDVWGIPNAELATIETSYLSGSRGLRLLEHGGVALRLKIDTGTETGKPAHPVPSLLRMARRGHDTGENWVEVNIRGSVAAGSILRDDRQFHLRKDSWIEKQLTRVSFEPARWWFLDGYEGIVEIWDEKGSGRDPVQDTDDRYEVVKKGDAWLIREFPRTSSERGGTS